MEPVPLLDPVAQLRQRDLAYGASAAQACGTFAPQLPPWCQDATRELLFAPPTPPAMPIQAWALESRFKAQHAADVQRQWAEEMQRSYLSAQAAGGMQTQRQQEEEAKAAQAAAEAAEKAAKCGRDAEALKQLLGVTPEKRRAQTNGMDSPARKQSGKPWTPGAAEAKTPDAKAKRPAPPPGLAELATPQKVRSQTEASSAKPRRRGGRRSGGGAGDKENWAK